MYVAGLIQKYILITWSAKCYQLKNENLKNNIGVKIAANLR